ncbi:MAG: TIGR02186 family protein [Thermodesulfobacteriota bacterium]
MGVWGPNLGKICWLSLLAAVALIVSDRPALALDLRLSPERVNIGAFFQGIKIGLEGEIPSASEAVVEVRGASVPEELIRKGRRGGLWMKVGEITVENALNLYLVMTSSINVPPEGGLNPTWGLAALRPQVKFRGSVEEKEIDRFFQEFLELKKSEGLYGTLPAALQISASGPGRSTVRGAFRLPAKVPAGRYQVRLLVLKDGRVIDQKAEELKVKMVGFPALIADMAYEHGMLYGIVAVVIAIATGFIMGFLFKGKAAH